MKEQNLLPHLGVVALYRYISSGRFGERDAEENFKWPPQRVVVAGLTAAQLGQLNEHRSVKREAAE